jgi:thiamine-phosphate pyrophosphorylase
MFSPASAAQRMLQLGMRSEAADLGLTPFYPILPDAAWIARLVPRGIGCVQLRYKGDAAEIRRQIAASLEVCIPAGCTLVVNDHWREALAVGASHVHLGQEDLLTAELAVLKARAVAIGVSTHDARELDLALAADADAIALGPIYATTAKAVGHGPQGLAPLRAWRARLGARSLIAIGGITLDRADDVLAAGADCVAVITDVTGHPSPEQRVDAWLEWQARIEARG